MQFNIRFHRNNNERIVIDFIYINPIAICHIYYGGLYQPSSLSSRLPECKVVGVDDV
jgi:hypothetical protein